MTASVEIFQSVIVVLGSFNPAIFTPDWLERNNLIGRDDADAARNNPTAVINRQVSQIETDWFVLQVLEDRFSLTSKGVLSPSLKDLAVGILSLVSHTPVTAVGLNFVAHYKFPNPDDRHKIGDMLVPKEVWKSIYPDENQAVGMVDVSVMVQSGKRENEVASNDYKRITVQPSSQVKNGVYFGLNDHHEIKAANDDKRTSAEITVQVMNEHWQSAWDEANRVFGHVIDRTLRA